MRTTLYVNRELLEEAMRLAKRRKMTETIDLALREFIRKRRIERLASRLGTQDLDLTLEELEEMRRDE